MINVSTTTRILSATSVFLFALLSIAQIRGERRRINVVFVGFVDRWSNYGSIGDVPSIRDFLALMRGPSGKESMPPKFIKLRFLYFPQDKSDPIVFAKRDPSEKEFFASREPACDESFSSLSRIGDVAAHDPDLRPSRFLKLSGDEIKLPQPKNLLPCYEVRWPSQK
jgi:hypothetical protein